MSVALLKTRKFGRRFPSADSVCVIMLFVCAVPAAVCSSTGTLCVCNNPRNNNRHYADCGGFVRARCLLLAKYFSRRNLEKRHCVQFAQILRASGYLAL